MTYIVWRKDRFYVVAYDGVDPLGRERRRWHPVGHDREEAEAIASRLDYERDCRPPVRRARRLVKPVDVYRLNVSESAGQRFARPRPRRRCQ